MGIKQSTLADAAPNPHAAHARLHRALEHHWHPHHVHALRHFLLQLEDPRQQEGQTTATATATVASLIPLLACSHSSRGCLPDPVAAHLAAMLASYALIDFQIHQLRLPAQLSSDLHSFGAPPPPQAKSSSLAAPTRALRLAINARPLTSMGMATRSPKSRRQPPASSPSNNSRPSTAPSTATSTSASSPTSFLDSPISYTTLISAVSHLILAIDVPGLPLHTPDLPSARLPSVAHSRRISATTAAAGAARGNTQPTHASPRSTKSSKSPLILSWLAPHVHYAHLVQLTLATFEPSSLLPPDPIPLVAQTCTVDDLAQVMAFAINLWAAAAASSSSSATASAQASIDPDPNRQASPHFLSPAPTSPHAPASQNHLSPTAFSPSASTRSIQPHPHRISGATIASSIFSRSHPHPPAPYHHHRPGSLFSTLSLASANDPGTVTPGNTSVFTDHGSALPDLETRTLRGQWDGGGVRAASLVPVRSMTMSFGGTSDEEEAEIEEEGEEGEEDDDNEEDPPDESEDAGSVASSVEPPDSMYSAPPPATLSSPTVAALDPDTLSSPPLQPTPSRPAGGASPNLAPLGTSSVASTHTRHRAGSMTSTTAVFHLRMGDLEDSGPPPPGVAHAPLSATATGERSAATAADRWSIRSHYPAPSILSAQTSAISTSTYHYHAPPQPRSSYGTMASPGHSASHGHAQQQRSSSFGSPSSPGPHVHYLSAPGPSPAAATVPAIVIPPSRLRPLAHRLLDLVPPSSSSLHPMVDWDAMVRLVLFPLLPHVWTWSLAPYLGLRLLGAMSAPAPAQAWSPGILGSHILPLHAAAPQTPANASSGPAPTGAVVIPSLIAHWLIQCTLVPPPPTATDASGYHGMHRPPPPPLTPVVGNVVYRATAHGWADAALHAALNCLHSASAGPPPASVVALVALAVPFAGSTDVEPVVVAVDLGSAAVAVRPASAVVVVSPPSVVQRVHAPPAATTLGGALVHVPGVLSVDLEQQQAHVWVAAPSETGGRSGLSLPMDVGAAAPIAAGPAGAVCVVLPVLDVELVAFA